MNNKELLKGFRSSDTLRFPNVGSQGQQCLFVFDSNYIYPFFVSLFSLLSNSECPKKVMVACNDTMLPNNLQSKIESFCEILETNLEFINVKLEGELPISKGFNTATYAKLFAISNIPNPYVYFDVDTLFVRGIDEIWSSNFLPLGKQAFSARPDPGISYYDSKNQAILNSNGRYFNAGVMVVNPSEWESLGYAGVFPSILSNYKELGLEWLDQCVFNYLAAGNYKEIPSRFNFFVGEKASAEEISVFHFAGSHKKPWRIPQTLFRRFFYLRTQLFAEPYIEYLKYERAMMRFLKRNDSQLFKIVKKFRKVEFMKAPHLIDLFLYKFEMRKFGGVVKILHNFFTSRRRKLLGRVVTELL